MFVPPAMSLFARLPARPRALGWAIRYALLGLGLAACPPLLAAPASSASATSAAAPTSDEESELLPKLSISGQQLAPTPSEESSDYGYGSSSRATGLNLGLRETPQSVSVISQEQILDFGLTDVTALLGQATGVNVEQVETDRTYYSVRGFEVSNFQIDGIGLPFATGDQLGNLDTALYDRVEVIRGANGLTAASGNPAATVNFVRKRPTADSRASVAATVGQWDEKRLDGDISGSLGANGQVRGRLVAAAEDSGSYLDRYALQKQLAGATLEIDLDSATLLTLGHSQQHNQPESPMWGALPLQYGDGSPTHYPASASSAAEWAYWDTSDVQSFIELNHALSGGWHSRAHLSKRTLSSDGEMLYIYTDASFAPGGSGVFSWPSKYNHEERQLIADLALSGPYSLLGRSHQLIVGANWGDSTNQLQSRDDDLALPLSEQQMLDGSFPRPDFAVPLSGYADFTNERSALYAATQLSASEQLKLLLGSSYSWVKSEGVQYGLDHNYRDDRALPYASATYDVSPAHALYASYATIFNPQHQTDMNGEVLDPIEGDSREIGVKSGWFAERLISTLALFEINQDNTAEYAGFADGQSRYRGVDARSRGFELDVNGQISSNWGLSGGYTKLSLKGENDEDVLLYVPRQTLRLTTAYRLAQLPALKVGASIKWQSDISNASDTVTQGSYALVDLMARYAINDHLSLTANLENLTDEQYLGSLLWAQGYYGAPRHASLNLKWSY